MLRLSSRRVGPIGFTTRALPSALPGLVAWGEAVDMAVSGTAIAAWPNRAIAALTPTQATGSARPTVVANAINGQPAVHFTRASAQFLSFPAGALGWFNNVAGATLFAVIKAASLPGTQNILTANVAASATPRLALQIGATNWFGSCRPDDSTVTNVTGGLATTTPTMLAISFDFAGGKASLYVNGALSVTSALSPVQKTPASDSQAVTLGAKSDATNASDLYVGAYGVCRQALTQAQLAPMTDRYRLIYGI